MPKPHYMLCADKFLIDKDTNIPTAIGILEEKTVSNPNGDWGDALFVQSYFSTLVVWRKDPDDEDQDFETNIRGFAPNGNVFMESGWIDFRFNEGAWLQRVIQASDSPSFLPLQSGFIRLESQIRRKGDEEILAIQTFTFHMILNPPNPVTDQQPQSQQN